MCNLTPLGGVVLTTENMDFHFNLLNGLAYLTCHRSKASTARASPHCTSKPALHEQAGITRASPHCTGKPALHEEALYEYYSVLSVLVRRAG